MKRNNIILMLLLFPMVTIMCVLQEPINETAPNSAVCTGARHFEGFATWRDVTCVFTCPDGQGSVQLAAAEIDATKEELTAIYCTIPPTPTPDSAVKDHTLKESTATPTSTPVVPDPDPMLTGEVTLCDPLKNVLNLRIVEGYDTTQFSSLKASIGGQAMTCEVNASNATIYTCSLPTPLTFPAQITLSGDGATLNDFSFDGSSCVAPREPKDDTEDPSEPVDCIANPLSPLC